LARNPPRIALIGCGAIAEEYYLPALQRHPAVLAQLILVDRDLVRARELAARFHVGRCSEDYRSVLGEVNGVILAIPTGLHHPIAMECLSCGVHVLCEKPLAESADKAREMIETAREHQAVLASNYLQRLWPQFAEVKRILATGSLGAPRHIGYYVGEVFDWPTVSGFYFNAGIASRGVLRDRGAHALDHVCWWLGGKPAVLSSQNDSFGGSEAVAHVRFERDGCSGEVRLSWLSKSPCVFTVECEKGSIAGEVYNFADLTLTNAGGQKRHVRLRSPIHSKSDAGQSLVTNFIDVICRGDRPLIEGKDVLDSIEFIDECYRMATRFEMPWYPSMVRHNVL
jgi:predicted dehydrogenase